MNVFNFYIFVFFFVFKDLLFDTAILLLLIKIYGKKNTVHTKKRINTHKHILYL